MEHKTKKSCKNIIHITFYTKDIDEAESIYRNICKEIDVSIDELEEELNLLILTKKNSYYSEITFNSYLVSPIEHLQELCIKYKVDIIGVSFDFKEGYVDSFSLYYDLNQTEEENHYILLTAENKENDSTFAINDDIKEDILNSDEIISDDIL